MFNLVPVICPIDDVWATNIEPLPIPDLTVDPTDTPVIVGGIL